MIANLPPYPAYKESGLPWLGKIPKHWELTPNRGLIRRRKMLVGKHHPNYRLLSLTKLGVIVRDVASGKGKFSSDMGTSQEVRRGDLVFCLFDIPETPRTVGLSTYDGMITGAYTVFECSNVGIAKYFELFYRAMDDRKLLSPIYSGLRNTIPANRFLGTKTPQPPPEEQASIVRFLNYAHLRLERTIRAKLKVIALLNEQKQVIIQRAVTRGLNSSVSLKPSNIPWLGDIPKHWEMRRLRHVISLNPSKLESIEVLLKNESVTFLPMERVGTDGRIDCTELRLASSLWSGLTYFRRGDVIVAKITPCFENGKGAFLNTLPTEIGFGSTEFHVLRPRPDILGDYLRLITSSIQFLINGANAMTGSAGQQRVSSEFIKNYPVPLPPKIEQEAILLFVGKEVSKIDRAATRLEREIELLREYQTRLVADVVTGKLDVRKVIIRIPDEAIESVTESELEHAAVDPELEPEENKV